MGEITRQLFAGAMGAITRHFVVCRMLYILRHIMPLVAHSFPCLIYIQFWTENDENNSGAEEMATELRSLASECGWGRSSLVTCHLGSWRISEI